MTDVAALVAALGGMDQKQQLVARGATDRDLTNAVKCGAALRARNGWYSTLADTSAAFRAVRVGGRLTGMSALVELGAWAYGNFPLHVSVPRNAARQRSPWSRRIASTRLSRQGVVLHWDDDDVVSRGTPTSVAVEDALLQAIIDEPLEVVVAALDWAFKSNTIDRIDFEQLMLRVPAWARGIRRFVDDNCDSLPESVVRTRLLSRGWRVQSQVRVGDFEEIDLVVEDCVAIEVDGDKFHRDRFEADRRKDLKITLQELHALRLSYHMVFDLWPSVLEAIELVLAAHGISAPVENSGNTVSRPPPRRPKAKDRRAPGQLSPQVPEFSTEADVGR